MAKYVCRCKFILDFMFDGYPMDEALDNAREMSKLFIKHVHIEPLCKCVKKKTRGGING